MVLLHTEINTNSISAVIRSLVLTDLYVVPLALRVPQWVLCVYYECFCFELPISHLFNGVSQV